MSPPHVFANYLVTLPVCVEFKLIRFQTEPGGVGDKEKKGDPWAVRPEREIRLDYHLYFFCAPCWSYGDH